MGLVEWFTSELADLRLDSRVDYGVDLDEVTLEVRLRCHRESSEWQETAVRKVQGANEINTFR